MTTHASRWTRGVVRDGYAEDQLCQQPHFDVSVEALGAYDVNRLGDVDCAPCLRRMAEKHDAIAEVFRARALAVLVTPASSGRCRVYDAECINPGYCDAHDACCAGDPDCMPVMP